MRIAETAKTGLFVTKRYKTKDKDQPYGLTRDGVPRKRPGRRKGSAKSPGTGRSKQPIELRLDIASDELALAVISGEPIHQYGTTGKAFTAPANLSLRQKFAEVWWNRRRPTLTAAHVKAEVTTEHREPAEPRELARSVLSILEHARLADERPIAEPFVDPRPAPHQLLLGRDAVIELQATTNSDAGRSISPALNGGSGVSGSGSPSLSTNTSPPTTSQGDVSDGEAYRLAAASPATDKLEHGDKLHIKSNDAHCWWDANRKKFAVFDSNNTLHGWRADKAVALAHAESLPRGDQVHYQQHPFAEVTAQQIGNEPRRDNLGRLPRAELRVVRQRPR